MKRDRQPAVLGPALRGGVALAAVLGCLAAQGTAPWRRLLGLWSAGLGGPAAPGELLAAAAAALAWAAAPPALAAWGALLGLALMEHRLARRRDPRPGPVRLRDAVSGPLGSLGVAGLVVAVAGLLLGELLPAAAARPGAAAAGLMGWLRWVAWAGVAALLAAGAVAAGGGGGEPPRPRGGGPPRRPPRPAPPPPRPGPRAQMPRRSAPPPTTSPAAPPGSSGSAGGSSGSGSGPSGPRTGEQTLPSAPTSIRHS